MRNLVLFDTNIAYIQVSNTPTATQITLLFIVASHVAPKNATLE